MNFNPFLEQGYQNKQFGKSCIKDTTRSVFNKTRVGYVLGYTFAANSNSVAIVDSTVTANTFDVYAVRISDESGNEALGYISPAAPATPVTVVTSNLVKSDEWKLDVIVQKGRGNDFDFSFQTNTLEIEGAKGSVAGTINEFWAVGTLNLQVSTTLNGIANTAKADVADGATLTLATGVIGDEVEATVYIQNTGAYPLDVYTVAITGDATAGAGQSGFAPFTLAPTGEVGSWKFVIKALAAVTYAVTCTVTNNTTNASYVIIVSFDIP